MQLKRMREAGVKNLYYLPLAANVERLKSSSSVAVIGFDCSVGRNPRWNCFSLSMKSRALALTASEHSNAPAAAESAAQKMVITAIDLLMATVYTP